MSRTKSVPFHHCWVVVKNAFSSIFAQNGIDYCVNVSEMEQVNLGNVDSYNAWNTTNLKEFIGF